MFLPVNTFVVDVSLAGKSYVTDCEDDVAEESWDGDEGIY